MVPLHGSKSLVPHLIGLRDLPTSWQRRARRNNTIIAEYSAASSLSAVYRIVSVNMLTSGNSEHLCLNLHPPLLITSPSSQAALGWVYPSDAQQPDQALCCFDIPNRAGRPRLGINGRLTRRLHHDPPSPTGVDDPMSKRRCKSPLQQTSTARRGCRDFHFPSSARWRHSRESGLSASLTADRPHGDGREDGWCHQQQTSPPCHDLRDKVLGEKRQSIILR